MNTDQLIKDYIRLEEGCREFVYVEKQRWKCGQDSQLGQVLCDTCIWDTKRHRFALQTSLTEKEDFLKFLENNYANFTWEGLRRSIKPMQKKIKELKTDIEKIKGVLK